MLQIDRAKVLAYAPFLEDVSFLPLGARILELVARLKSRGERGCFARKTHQVALAGGTSTTAQTYKLQTVREENILAVTEIHHPSDGTASIICTDLSVNAGNYVHSDAVMDSWCDAPAGEDARGLPWPIIVGAGDVMAIKVTGTTLPISTSAPAGLVVHGFYVDDLTAAILRHVGELFVEGFNVTFAAATIMTSQVARTFDREKEFTHFVSKETLTGDTVRSTMVFTWKGHKMNPRDGADAVAIPPTSTRRVSARVSIAVQAGDSTQFNYRYTSAAGTGTALLQVTGLGRARYRGL